MNTIALNLAYKFVAFALMIGESNFFADKVGLQLDHPIAEAEIQNGSHVGTPSTNDFSGSVITGKYFFGFGWGHLANFYQRDFRPNSDTATRERNVKLAKLTSLIDADGAGQLAANWLGSIGVDVRALEKKCHLNVIQWKSLPQGFSDKPILLPVYQVEWRGPSPFSKRRTTESVLVSMTILGTTKELVEFHVLDDSLFARPRLQIVEPEKLIKITDNEFQTYNTLQKSSLVSQFTQKPTLANEGRK